MVGLICSPIGSSLRGFATVGSGSVGTGQGLVVFEKKKRKKFNMAETSTMLKAGNWYCNVGR